MEKYILESDLSLWTEQTTAISIIKGGASSQKYMLVPESIYQQKMKIDTRDVLQRIKHPEQRKMLKCLKRSKCEHG